MIFYIIFYVILSAFFVALFLIFTSTLKDGRPKYELKESLIGANPGLGFRPMPPESNVESTLVWYEKQNTDYWVEEIDRFLKGISFFIIFLNNSKFIEYYCQTLKRFQSQ